MTNRYRTLQSVIFAVLASAMHVGRGQTTQSSLSNSTTESLSPFLKHGETYDGRLATKILEEASSSVAVLVTIDNWSRWALLEPQLEMQCGRLVVKEERDDKGLPELIRPGFSEMIMFEKTAGISGVCGVVTYTLEVSAKEDPDFIQIMFSVPYNLQTYDAYFAIGISQVYLNISGLFDTLYYYDGSFKRATAGNLEEFASQRIKLRASMEPDTYKPLLSLSILPVIPEDRFEPGEYIPPWLRSGQRIVSEPRITLLLLMPTMSTLLVIH